MPTLTQKQQRFIEEFLKDLNSTQAAIRAGYSERTANQQGPRLLGHPGVRSAIDAAKAKRSEQARVDAAWVLKRLVDEAAADLADLYNVETGALKPVQDWPEIWRQGLVQGIELEELFADHGEDRIHIGWVRKIKLSDRVKRLEMIGRHVGVQAFKKVVQHQGIDGLAERLARAIEREKAMTIEPDPLSSSPAQAGRNDCARAGDRRTRG